ncbi:MAG TPA: circularly permuted type 2 ATP-grasp protein, partial [Steroidobacteraceae bacterium]|nr:circularly permuted type 2 ATP-grasp protein [Steroidobacteraceae bacterium]
MTETDALLEHYRPIAGVPDELKDTSGSIRCVWRQFLDHFLALGQEERTARFGRGRQYLRDAGVYYRIYGSSGSAEHDWPLSAVPVLIDGEEWQRITAALEQRADLLERVMADLYGANRLVGEGHLPAALIADNPEWLRPLVGVTPASGHFLHLVGFEIGRGPDGQWWVLGDRTQGPSGLAFALENRVATSRMYAELFAAANVHRLAGFFRVFRDALQNLRRDSGGPIGILTPGPLNDTYFEHAFIARYLGCTLLEGEDLVVEHGQVMVRTVAGPRPISVLWRRIDSAYVDPLELDERSQLGTAGMVEALRQRSLAMINMPGSGLLETRAMLAFLPRICEALLGEPLRMPNIATWWCGQERERAHVQENLASMVVGPALSTRLPFDFEEQTVLGGRSGGRPAEAIRQWIDSQGGTLVGQEAVTLSTTPAWIDNRLQPRPMSLRVFLARTPHGWQAMPGGFARIGRTEDPTAIAMQRGGSVADVWVVSDNPVATPTMLPSPNAPYRRTEAGVLPSRAADNLYWLGRYV